MGGREGERESGGKLELKYSMTEMEFEHGESVMTMMIMMMIMEF